MSIYSRDYMREEPGSRKGPGPRSWTVITWLLVINISVFMIDVFFRGAIQDTLGLSLTGLMKGKIWTLVTYQFVHDNPMHIIMNMLGLFFFGRNLLFVIEPRHAIRIYLLGGLVGGVFQLIYSLIMKDNAHIVGASGSVLALFFAFVAVLPNQPMRLLFPPITITPKGIALVFIAFDLITLLLSFAATNSSSPHVAVMAHFGGMLLGWLYVKKGFHQTKSRPRKQGQQGKKKGFGIRILRDEEKSTNRGGQESKPFVTDEIDAILDKINENGFQSLTEDERRILDRSSKKLSKRIDKDS